MTYVQKVAWQCDHCLKQYTVESGTIELEGWLHIAHWQPGEEQEQIDVCPTCVPRVSKTLRSLRRSKT